ncbi:hypothetical protein GOP47_0018066 [Adiantum capillus-veneris]|uniref:Large ribosomal subunit protein bL25 beta domain-containing protein n=1 Tax=Adiantum capillus-veneris TaxID=13818 RepID=A0A9D4Z9T1_ADICA|nr:hypothetical protein GOP47_0018066 [Adiantum capillus-veneris]
MLVNRFLRYPISIFHSAQILLSRGRSTYAPQEAQEQPAPSKELISSNCSNSEIITLWASYRLRGGEKLHELRKKGMVASMVSDFDAENRTQYNHYIALQRKEVWGYVTQMGRQDFMSHFYNLALHEHPESDQIRHVIKVYPRKLYLINGRRTILNVAFVRARHNVKLRMIIPLKFRGRTVCPGLINGGKLVVLKKAVSCLVYPDEVPPYIEVDVSKLKVGERILLDDLNVDLASRRQAGYVVCEVKKYQLVRPSRSRSLAWREFPDIFTLDYDWGR